MLNLPTSAVQPVVTILSPISHSLQQPLFALIVFCLSPQVEDRDHLEKVGGKLCQIHFLLSEVEVMLKKTSFYFSSLLRDLEQVLP